jgi:IS30 family transposase
MASRGKTHEIGMLKIEKKKHIHAWKEEEVSSEKIAQRLERHWSSINRLVVKSPRAFQCLSPMPTKRALNLSRKNIKRPL